MSGPVRVVLDTNVVLSALLFTRGSLVWLRESWQTSAVVPLLSRETATELLRVLGYPKFKLTREERDAVLGEFLPWCETIVSPRRSSGERRLLPVCRDPHDVPFLDLAIAARAKFLVTGDADLLAIAASSPIPILTPAEFRLRLTPAPHG